MGKKTKQAVIPVFQLKPLKNSNKVKIIYAGNISPNEKLGDNSLECAKKDADDFIDVNTYKITNDVFGKIFQCNILGAFLMSTKKLPVMYASIMYNKKNILTGFLCSIFVYFVIEENITSEKQLIGTELTGKYVMEIKTDSGEKSIEMENFTSVEETIEKLKAFTTTESMIEIIGTLLEIRDKERSKEMGAIEEDYAPPVARINISKLAEKRALGQDISADLNAIYN
jgi:hypothetical protein